MSKANAAISAVETDSLHRRFAATRSLTRDLVAPLSEADATIQSMEDASPAKWHLAHTTWFFETFLLRDHKPGYRLFDEDWPFLFNSYYEAEGSRIDRFARGMLSRPTVAQIVDWRDAVEEAMQPLLAEADGGNAELSALIELGISHEQQHQELLLTDIKHALSRNPLKPAMWDGAPDCAEQRALGWHEHPGGIARIGHDGSGFAFDCEGPSHRVLLEPFSLADRLVTNGEYADFIADGGYENAALWLADGWAWLNENAINAPAYWRDDRHFTLQGMQPRDPHAPVTHLSHFEADAYATWAGANWQGARLPTEFEWEAIARGQHADEAPAHDPAAGNQLDGAGPVHPVGAAGLFGDCWQFTRSAYLPYPRFEPAAGAIGEYNGKFMSGQVVLRGASCATARGHSRPSYRNFFYPHQRWQFTGIRLAKDV